MDAGDRAFRFALRAFPREFRERFGGEMIEFFRARRAQARARGTNASFMLRTSLDLLASLARERSQRLIRCGETARAALSVASLSSDVSGAARFLRRSPGLTAAVIFLMGSGVAASAGIFSVVNHVLLTPPPFAEPDRLAFLWETRPERGASRYSVGAHEYPVWAQRAHTLESSAAFTFTGGSASLTGEGEPAALFGVRVVSSFFTTLGTPPMLGRGFTAGEDVPGRGQVVVISHRLWRERFSGSTGVIGRRILLDDRPFEVVGVMPAAFAFPAGPPGVAVDIWRPIAEPFNLYRGRHYMMAIARVKPGVSFADAERDLNAIAEALEKELPAFNKGHRVMVRPLASDLVEDASATLMLLQASVLGLLLIGCANAAGLLLASGLERRREIAVRLALGARRLRVARQLLAETLMLSAAACAAGLGGAWLLIRAVPALVPGTLLSVDGLQMDWAVVVFATLVSLATAALIGLAPIAQVSGVELIEALKGRGTVSERMRARRALVIGQVALTLVLAAGAAVSIRTLAALHRIDTGFETENLFTSSVALPAARYATATASQQFYTELEARLAAHDGIESVALANAAPLDGSLSGIAVGVEGRPAPRPGEEINVRFRVVSSGYFRTLGIPMVEGRGFAESDARRAVPLIKWYPQQPAPPGFDLPQPPPVAVINESMARALWPEGNAVGSRFTALLSAPITVVGIARDARDEGLASPPRPEFYLHNRQEPIGAMTILVKARPGAAVAPMIRSVVWGMDRALPIGEIAPMADLLSMQVGLPRFTSMLMGGFAALALALMAAGVYALIAFSTKARSKEIGLRMALGAPRAHLVRIIVRQGLALAALGTAAGGLLVILGRSIAERLPAMGGALGAVPIAAAALIVLAVVAVASWLPARRAARVDPLVVLRQD
jgi:predicted permease